MKANYLASALFIWTQWISLSAVQETYHYTKEQRRNANRTLSIGYVIFDGYEMLDVSGPLEFLFEASYRFNMTLSIIANNTGPIHTRSPSFLAADGSVVDTSHMLDAQLIATHTFTSAPPLDILILPGGFGSTLLMTEEKDGHITDFVASRFHHTDYVISVCTGAGFLARAGVLEGRRATTNKAGWAGITQHGRNITWIPSARWVQDGKVWTSSGVSAGMDMMVAFLRHVYGDPIINDVVNVVEYAPHTDPTWDPFSVVDNVSPWLIEGKGSRMRVSADKKRVPGANMSRSLVDCVSPLEEYPDVS